MAPSCRVDAAQGSPPGRGNLHLVTVASASMRRDSPPSPRRTTRSSTGRQRRAAAPPRASQSVLMAIDPQLDADLLNPWLRSEALGQGHNDRSISRLVRSGDWHRVRHGAYIDGGLWAGLGPEDRHRVRARAVLKDSPPHDRPQPHHRGRGAGSARLGHRPEERATSTPDRRAPGPQDRRGRPPQGPTCRVRGGRGATASRLVPRNPRRLRGDDALRRRKITGGRRRAAPRG